MPAPQEFALQFWDAQKTASAGIVLGIMDMMVSGKGGASGDSSMVRFLVELALASNAPTQLKMLVRDRGRVFFCSQRKRHCNPSRTTRRRSRCL